MKKYLSVLFLIMFIVPSVALASWWNPFSWKVFHKKEVVPQTQIINNPVVEPVSTAQEIEKLQKQLDDLKKKQPDSINTITPKTPVVSSKKPVVPKTDTVSTSKPKTGEISSSDLIKVVDNLINNYNSLISSYLETQDFANGRIDDVSEISRMLSPMLKDANSCERDWDEWFLKILDGEEKWQKAVINTSLASIKAREWRIDSLKTIKNNIPKYVTTDYYLTSFNSLETYYKEIEKYKEAISDDIKEQKMVIEKEHEALDKWKSNVDSCLSGYINNYNAPNTYNYNPVVVPQIQIPKTTYCTMGLMSGTQSYYSITCN